MRWLLAALLLASGGCDAASPVSPTVVPVFGPPSGIPICIDRTVYPSREFPCP